MSGFVETYRGVVFPWEVDQVGHLTVAYYFERLEDATLGLLDAIGLGADYIARGGRGCVTADCYVRYQHELRVGDILHIESGVIAVDTGGMRLGHKLFDSDTGTLCTTVEQGVRHVQLEGRSVIPLTVAQQAAASD